MKPRYATLAAALLVFVILIPVNIFAQETLDRSATWFGKALRGWFPKEIRIHGSLYSNKQIRCSNVDLTHFTAKAGKVNIGAGPAFQIAGRLRLDALPSGLSVIDGANGKAYMPHLQAYLFSPTRKVIWSQQGFPAGQSWVNQSGSTMSFTLINGFSSNLRGCTAAILAVGDPIFVEGSSETSVILGMKRFSFKDETSSTRFDSSVSRPVAKSKAVPKATKHVSRPTKKYSDLKYVAKRLKGWKYDEVTSIPVADRKKIFYDMVLYQDTTGDDEGAYRVIGNRYGLPPRAMRAIVGEGALKNWPMP